LIAHCDGKYEARRTLEAQDESGIFCVVPAERVTGQKRRRPRTEAAGDERRSCRAAPTAEGWSERAAAPPRRRSGGGVKEGGEPAALIEGQGPR
jgi:hypothetical protein